MKTYLIAHRRCLSIAAIIVCTACLSQEAARGLRFDAKGEFKIVQFTDTHGYAGKVIESVLDKENPNLVILTSDIADGPKAKDVWKRIESPMIARKIPWAATLGNHDYEGIPMKRSELIPFLSELPYSCAEAGPANLGSGGNYALDVKARKGGVAAVIYCMDSQKNGMHAGHVAWHRKESNRRTKANNGKSLPGLAFFHIALPQFQVAWETLKNSIIGYKGEGVFGRGTPEAFKAMLKARDVMGIFVGHCHKNDYAVSWEGICLAFGRISGPKAYGGLDKEEE